MSTTSTDPIADMLSRIRNAIAVRKNQVSLPHSKVKEAVARMLAANNFIDDVKVEKATIGKIMTLSLFPENSNARITEIKRLSKPGRRHYVNSQGIPVVMRGRGLVIVSTSKGLMTGVDAKKSKIGGELICKVY
jgi:small subunit ribosomal protein S8